MTVAYLHALSRRTSLSHEAATNRCSVVVCAAGLLLATALARIVLRDQFLTNGALKAPGQQRWTVSRAHSRPPRSLSALIAPSKSAAVVPGNDSGSAQHFSSVDGLRQLEHTCRQHFGRLQAGDAPAAEQPAAAAADSTPVEMASQGVFQNDSSSAPSAEQPLSPAAPMPSRAGEQSCSPSDEFLVNSRTSRLWLRGPSSGDKISLHHYALKSRGTHLQTSKPTQIHSDFSG